MKILRHLTANEEILESFPFKRELSMKSYLIENESVLTLDDTFCDVQIIEEELIIKEGRPSKDTNGYIDILITYAEEYIGVVELKLGQLTELHLQQLEDYLSKKEQILHKYPDILSKDSEPKFIGVLVGDSISAELSNKITNGYQTDDGIQIAALTIQRFKSKQGRVYITTDTHFKNTLSAKDMSKYLFNGTYYGKGRLVLAVVKQYVEDNPNISFAELERIFSKSCHNRSSKFGVFTTLESAKEIETRGRKRHFLKSDELIKLSDSTIAVTNQWGIGNIDNLIKVAETLGYKITK